MAFASRVQTAAIVQRRKLFDLPPLLFGRRQLSISFPGRFPAFQRNIVHALEERLQELEQRFREVSTDKVGSRLSSELIRLSNHLGRASGNAEIGLPRSELAQLTGTMEFTVSRLLTRWQTLGIVSSRREAVQVHDFAALAQISESEWRKSGFPAGPCTELAS